MLERTPENQINLFVKLFFFYAAPTGYWFLVIIPINLVHIIEVEIIILFLILFLPPILVVLYIFSLKISFFVRKFDKFMFLLMIICDISFFILIFNYPHYLNLSIILLSIINVISAINTPYLFAKIVNLLTKENKVRILYKLFSIWFGGGIIFVSLFIINSSFSLILSFFFIAIGILYQYKYQIREKNYLRIQLLPFYYRSIANTNVLGIYLVLILFWSVASLILKEFYIYQINNEFLNFEEEILALLFFLSLNVLLSVIIFWYNKRINLRLLFFLDYILISLSVVIVLFWRPLLPLAVIFVSSFGIITFTSSLPDLMDINKGIIGYSFMSFFHILLITFPLIQVIIFVIDEQNTNQLASMLLIIIIIAMALMTEIKFIPAPVSIEYFIIFHKNGIPLLTKGYASKDEKIISGLLTGILTILNASMNMDSIKTIDHGDKKIIVSSANKVFGVIVCDRYNKTIGYKLQEIVDLFEAGFDKVLDLNAFNVNLFKKLPPLLQRKIEYLIAD